jgi:hypothetical protein
MSCFWESTYIIPAGACLHGCWADSFVVAAACLFGIRESQYHTWWLRTFVEATAGYGRCGQAAIRPIWNIEIHSYIYGKRRQRVTCTMDNNLRVIYIVYPWHDEKEEFHNFSLIFQSSFRVLGSSSLQGMLFNSYVTATGLNITVQIFHLCCFTRGDVQSSAD